MKPKKMLWPWLDLGCSMTEKNSYVDMKG